MSSDRPLVSVIVPCRNEERYIAHCLDSILASDYPHERLEVLVVDGRSEDGTRDILARYAARHSMIRVLDNPQRIIPAALNIGIRAAQGEVIVRLDAHAGFPRSYIAQVVAALLVTGADAVGGAIVTLPADGTATARAIALALSHPLGVGNSYFRIGAAAPRWVDHVPFGCYRRDVFDRIGLFDEELLRSEDGEFSFRLSRHGGRILLLPDVVARYYARDSLQQLRRMFYQYGYFKAIAAKKVGRIMTGRQLAPALFILSLAATGLLGAWLPAGRVLFAGLVGLYATIVLAAAGRAARKEGIRCGLVLAAAFPLMHFNYGLGYLRAVFTHWLRLGKPTPHPAAVAPTR
jgi:glycosyltransferase involved in cell wall biosynthesis